MAEYRKSLENEIKENQSKELEKLNIELDCVNNIIDRLKAQAEAVTNQPDNTPLSATGGVNEGVEPINNVNI